MKVDRFEVVANWANGYLVIGDAETLPGALRNLAIELEAAARDGELPEEAPMLMVRKYEGRR